MKDIKDYQISFSKLLTCMSKPGTDLLRLPIEPSDVSGSSRRSSVDTYSVIKNTDQQLSYDTNSVLV